jgi:hypothetical protein
LELFEDEDEEEDEDDNEGEEEKEGGVSVGGVVIVWR